MKEQKEVPQGDQKALFLECIEKELEEDRKRTAREKARAFAAGGIPRLKTPVSEYVDGRCGREGAAQFVMDEWPRIQKGTSPLAPAMARKVDALASAAFGRTYMILAVEKKIRDGKAKKKAAR